MSESKIEWTDESDKAYEDSIPCHGCTARETYERNAANCDGCPRVENYPKGKQNAE